jgi:class 3 adenylate cyclase
VRKQLTMEKQRTQIFPWQLSGRTRHAGFLTRRLRHLIIIPYLILATLLALVVTYLLMSAANQSLTDRFNAQLLDAGQGGSARLVQAESQQLQALRAIAFTQGFPETILARDGGLLETLSRPQAANYDLDSVVVVAKDGTVLLAMPSLASDPTAPTRVTPALAPAVNAALNPAGDFDKVSTTVRFDSDSGALFYTAGPVRQGDQIVGALLVGTDLSRLLRQIGRDSLSDGVTYYGADGAPVGNTLAASRDANVTPLPAGWYQEISDGLQDKVRVRTITIGPETYVEALGPVPGHGLGGTPPGVYGVMLRTHSLDARLEQTLWAMLPVFALALGLTVVIGLALANWIDRPLTQLMIASGRVARGDLEAQVPVTRNDELGVLSARFNDMVGGLRQLLFVKDLFGRFVSREVSAKLLAGQIELGGEQREVTILFSDLRDFTKLSEQHSPTEIVDLLNEYFSSVVRAAARNGGIVNKFGGDSTLIIFGAPVDMPDHADRALATALEMSEAMSALSAHRNLEGWKPLRQGIGINTGTVVAGQIGSEDRMEYTVIGDAVNVASRLQAMTKRMKGCDIVFSGSTLDALTDPLAWLWENKGFVDVRGKNESIAIYNLLGKSDAQHSIAPLPVDDLLRVPSQDLEGEVSMAAAEGSRLRS